MGSPFEVTASSGGGSEQVPAGNHPAVMVGLIDLGTHDNSFQGQAKDPVRKVFLVWELVTEKIAGGGDRNHVIGAEFTFSFASKAKLRQFVEKWRGRPFPDGEKFDISVLLGKQCLLAVGSTVKGNNTYTQVDAATAIPKGMTIPAAQHAPVAWSLGQGDFPQQELSWLPYCFGKSVADKIAESHERKGKPAQPSTNGDGHAASNGAGQQQQQQALQPAGVADEIPF